MESVYVLYGTEVVNEINQKNPNHKEISEYLKGIGGMMKKYEISKNPRLNSSIIEVLEDSDGWYTNKVISKEDYEKILSYM